MLKFAIKFDSTTLRASETRIGQTRYVMNRETLFFTHDDWNKLKLKFQLSNNYNISERKTRQRGGNKKEEDSRDHF